MHFSVSAPLQSSFRKLDANGDIWVQKNRMNEHVDERGRRKSNEKMHEEQWKKRQDTTIRYLREKKIMPSDFPLQTLNAAVKS